MIRWKAINIVPLVILLALLVFVFVLLRAPYRPAFSFRVRALPPHAYDRAGKGVDSEFVIVSVDKGQNIAVGGRPVRREDLRESIRRAFAERPLDRRKVLVRASGSLSYGDVAKVIDEIKGAAPTAITLQGDHLDGP